MRTSRSSNSCHTHFVVALPRPSVTFSFLYYVCRSGASVAARFEADWESPDALANLTATATNGTNAATTGAPQVEHREATGRSTAPANDAKR